jgi:hypothetical protein
MNGAYTNIKKFSKPFLFYKNIEEVIGRSARLDSFTYAKVGAFKPLEFKGNVLVGPSCITRWNDE